jgi:hypothetical protein
VVSMASTQSVLPGTSLNFKFFIHCLHTSTYSPPAI